MNILANQMFKSTHHVRPALGGQAVGQAVLELGDLRAELGLYPIVALGKQLLDMLGNLI